jgi:hypothetical protein
MTMDLTETENCPAIVTQEIDDQISEVIHTLVINSESEVIAVASVFDNDVEYNLETFEVPMLIAILESVEKHLE